MTSYLSQLKVALRTCGVLVAGSIGLQALEVPEGFGQLKNEPKLIAGGIDEMGREYSYFGQVASDRKLILTASNGFFSKGVCVAKGESDLPKVGDEQLIKPNYDYLDWKRTEGSLRWHILVRNPGKVHFNVHLQVVAEGADLEVNFAGQTKKVKTSRLDSAQAQPWNLTFDVKKPGEYLFSLKATNLGQAKGVGHLHRVDAFGPAIEGANLLRVRWRPAAAHGSYDTGKVRDAKLLVFTTRSIADVSSYSPITTPFGYYGTTFGNDRRSGGSFNFSMWGKKGASTDLKLMPHLLGVGSPEGEFSGFGHEGSGVKPRGWVPMPDRPELVVQALRVVPGKNYDSYYGYYFDHPTKAWKFFGAGNKWHGGKPKQHLKLGSFCEVPGPPQVERTGDVYREVRRRLWAFDEGKWVFLERYQPGGKGSSGKISANKSWYTTKEGEYAMGCGGIRLYRHRASQVFAGGGARELPYFLASASIDNIFKMPIQYGKIQASKETSKSAVIEINIPKGGDLKAGAVYYGTSDALTFAPRKLHGTEKNSDLSKAVNSLVWKEVAKVPKPRSGINRVEITKLKSGTVYYYRVLMENGGSRIWNDQTLTFETLK